MEKREVEIHTIDNKKCMYLPLLKPPQYTTSQCQFYLLMPLNFTERKLLSRITTRINNLSHIFTGKRKASLAKIAVLFANTW